MARIEVPQKDIPRLVEPKTAENIDRHFRSLGYQYITVDLAGFRSGSLNEVITIGNIQPTIR